MDSYSLELLAGPFTGLTDGPSQLIRLAGIYRRCISYAKESTQGSP